MTAIPTQFQRYVLPPLQREEAIESTCSPEACKGCSRLQPESNRAGGTRMSNRMTITSCQHLRSPLWRACWSIRARTSRHGFPRQFVAASRQSAAILRQQVQRRSDRDAATTALARFAAGMSPLTTDEREELYTATFDVTPACVPYVSIHLFGEENFKRGEFMAALHAAL